MKNNSIKRRDFIRVTSAAGLAAGWGTAFGGFNAEAQSSRPRAQVETVLSALEKQGGQVLSVARKEGEFLRLLVHLAKAKNVLEVGAAFGYASVWLADALTDTGGKLTSIEILPERLELAKKSLTDAGLHRGVTFLQGDAHGLIPKLEGGPYDLAFLDADKDGLVDYFEKLHPDKIAPGGILCGHGAIRAQNTMKKFLQLVREHPDYETAIVSLTMEDGLFLCRRST